MIKNSATYISKIILVAIFVSLSFFQKELYGAKDTGVERIRECKDNNGAVGDFEPMLSGSAYDVKVGKEMDYDLSNPFCVAQFAGAYAAIKVSLSFMNGACGTGSPFPRLLPSLPKDLYEITKAGKKARSLLKDSAKHPCPGAFLLNMGRIGTAIGEVFVRHKVAEDHYNIVKVCGSNWRGPDIKTQGEANIVINNYKMVSNANYSHSKEVADYLNRNIYTTIKDAENAYNEDGKKYREWFYGGKEFEDAPAEGETCVDPSRDFKPQRYYLRGLDSNYMCEKYNPNYHNDKDDLYKIAYKCCLERSQNYICLEKSQLGAFSAEHMFCKGDSKCTFKNNIAVSFATYRRDNKRLICAKSYSLCPFNFAVGGGSPYPNYFLDVDKNGKAITDKMINDSKPKEGVTQGNATPPCDKAESRNSDCSFNGKLGKLKNYCQYFQHCTTTNSRPYVADLSILNAYYSKACIDFVGDSQNGVKKLIDAKTAVSYNGGFLFGEQTNFSAPIVQCFKETMKNIFTNTAGHSRCMDLSFGNSTNECKDSYDGDSYFTSGNFIWKKGNKVKENSLFEFLQKRLKMIITTVLVISITFLGFKILVGKLDLSNKKEILVYIIKIAFVIYFVNGTAWKDIFFDGIYNGSNEISRIFFKIKLAIDTDNPNLCNFGNQENKDGIKNVSTIKYPAGSEYLMVWDTLDCKIMQYLNYGPGFTTSTMVVLIIAAFFTGGIGLIIALSVFIMAVCLILATIRAMHIFISSAIAIIIYIFISPLIIPLVLFEKTKSIFDAWFMQLMSFTLSPIVLFAYLGIFISLSEDIMYGGANSFKDGKINCSEYCVDKDGNRGAKNEYGNCGDRVTVDPFDLSVACILNFNDFSENPGFALFGITLPSIAKLLHPEKAQIRILLVLKSALFLFILAQFMDEIPGIAGRLTGEVIDVKGAGFVEVMKKFTSTMRGIQKRGARLVKGAGIAQLNNAKEEASKDKGEKDGGGGGNKKDVVGSNAGDK